MAFKGDDSTFSLTTTVTLAIAVAAMVLVKNPLQSSRPPGTGTGLQQATDELSVRARLWEDPFAAVEREVNAQKPIALQVVTDGKQVGQVAATVSLRSPDAHNKGLKRLSGKIKEAGNERVLALVVMTGGGTSVEAVEERIRDRYAVGAALEVGCFAPDKAESLSYFTWNYRIPSKAQSKEEKLLSQYTPYEWYSLDTVRACPYSGLSQTIEKVLVLWVKRWEGEERILARIDALLSVLASRLSSDKRTVSELPFQVKLVGPRTSSEFRSILQEIEKHNPKEKYRWQQTKKNLQVYSPWATAMPDLLLRGLKEQKKRERAGLPTPR